MPANVLCRGISSTISDCSATANQDAVFIDQQNKLGSSADVFEPLLSCALIWSIISESPLKQRGSVAGIDMEFK